MTLDEKVMSCPVEMDSIVHGSHTFQAQFTISIPRGEDTLTSCQGRILPIERIGFPGMCLADAGNGLRQGELSSTWPAGISVAAR